MKSLLKTCADDLVFLDVVASDMRSVLQFVLDELAVRGRVDHREIPQTLQAFLQREAKSSTAIGHAVAVPHAYLDCFREPLICVVRLAQALPLGAPDGIPTRFVFVLVGPPNATLEHLDALASIARIMSDNEFRFEAQRAQSAAGFRRAVERFQKRTVPSKSPEKAKQDGLTFTGRLAGGMWQDVLRRWPFYFQDFREGFAFKGLAATVFLFFACLAPAITFGGFMAAKTGGDIGAVEMIVASALCGMAYALLGGQPLIILGGTGPMLIFTAILYELCQNMQIPFLPTYAWVGLWSAGILLVLAVTDASCWMRVFTRFTDEIFAALISIIFIFEAVKAMVEIFEGLEAKRHHDTALLSLLLALGTFYIASTLSRMRSSRYLSASAREFLSDFGPIIAIGSMAACAFWLHEVYLELLPAPDHFQTTSGRPWRVDLFSAPVWVRWAACGPAALVSVLTFLDQNITARLVNSPDNRLKRGPAYHLDLAVVGLLIGVCSLFGLPWLVAATVRSLNHVRSLATFEPVVANQEHRVQILHVRENRVTGFAIHALLGASLLLLPYLKLIPMAVLFGLFLYMGVISMAGNQFFERLRLWLTDPELYPSTHYIRRVPILRVHLFTVIQLVCLIVLWVIKASAWGILFPLFIAALVPVRFVMARVLFSGDQMAALDAEEEPEDEELQWA